MKKTDLKNIVLREVLYGFDLAWLNLDKILDEHNCSSDDKYFARDLLHMIELELISKYKKD